MRASLSLTLTELNTPRLSLRPYQPEMSVPFWQLIQENRERLLPDFPDRTSAVITLQDAEKRLRALTYQWNSDELYSFGIWLKETDEYVGDLSLRRLAPNKPLAEVGYYLAAKAEGQGIATEALKGLLRFAFQDLHMETVTLRCGQDNEKSQRIAERCGFTKSKKVSISFADPSAKEGRPIYTYHLQRIDPAAQLL